VFVNILLTLLRHTLYSKTMRRKKYIIAGIIILLILLGAFLTARQNQQKGKQPVLQPGTKNQQANQSFTVVDSSFSPQSQEAITHNEILRETQPGNPSLQRFVVKSPIDGSVRELFEIDENNVTFEKITPQNWSPTNRFVFVYVDYPNRRDIIFMKTDGTFTDGQYWLHSTGLYPNLNIISAKWIDTADLSLQTMDIKTHAAGNYVVDFDDDTGVMMPESVYNKYYKGD
jgi:hypothetical protein